MSNPNERVTQEVLRSWGLPEPGNSKKARGRVMIVGGSRRTPGAAMLAGEAALRVGAGRLGVLVPASIDQQLGIVLPEAAIHALPERAEEPFGEGLRDEIRSADAVLVGPGFDDPDETLATLHAVAQAGPACLVLDAFALGVLSGMRRASLPSALILNPNEEEAAILLGRDFGADRLEDLREIARRYGAVVNCYGTITAESGTAWQVGEGGAGLSTSGSGDVLAGAITGFAARGIDPMRAAVWGSWTHARAGDRLTERVGLGFLARELPKELTGVLREVSG
jgi:ADP-dependent NAD(P)H-hydrate dehydratase